MGRQGGGGGAGRGEEGGEGRGGEGGAGREERKGREQGGEGGPGRRVRRCGQLPRRLWQNMFDTGDLFSSHKRSFRCNFSTPCAGLNHVLTSTARLPSAAERLRRLSRASIPSGRSS